jgi:hypothetical protein
MQGLFVQDVAPNGNFVRKADIGFRFFALPAQT